MLKKTGTRTPYHGTCQGAEVAVSNGRVAPRKTVPIHLSGEYVIGASSIASIKGIEGELKLGISVKSIKGDVVWERDYCIIGKKACSIRRYADTLRVPPGKYVIELGDDDVPKGIDATLCVSPVHVGGGILVSGARPDGFTGMSPAPGSTSTRSLMVAEPVTVGDSCIQRMWLWFFEPRALMTRYVELRLMGSGGATYSTITELPRVGAYSEAVFDVIVPAGGGEVVVLDPADLTRPLFNLSIGGCGDGG